MAKTTTKPEAIATANDRARKTVPLATTIPESDIARRAYDLYLARGREDGHDVEDWLQAERELGVDAEC
jgi:hypothetical protein